jgi:hypothetical protein
MAQHDVPFRHHSLPVRFVDLNANQIDLFDCCSGLNMYAFPPTSSHISSHPNLSTSHETTNNSHAHSNNNSNHHHHQRDASMDKESLGESIFANGERKKEITIVQPNRTSIGSISDDTRTQLY